MLDCKKDYSEVTPDDCAGCRYWDDCQFKKHKGSILGWYFAALFVIILTIILF